MAGKIRNNNLIKSLGVSMAGVFYRRRKCRTAIFLLVLCMAVLFRVPALAAQAPYFRLDMESLNLRKGSSSNIIISLGNAQGAQIVRIDGLESFDTLSQSRSTSTSIVGSEVTYQEDLYYVVMPKTAGEYTIKAVIQYNGQNYETNALQVTVSEGTGGNKTAEDLFIKTVLSHDEAYLGEKIVVTYELYSRYNVDNYGFTDYIAFDGVIAKEIPENQLKAEYEYLDGERYAVYEVRQFIIDPLKPGVCSIPSFNFQVNVITNGGISGGLGGLFRSSTPMYLQTEEKEITIKPLPADGKPKDFSGVVGELRLDGQYSREEMNYGDSFALRLTASGRCNLDGLKNIVSGNIPGFSVYETQKNVSESVENNQYRVEKAFEIIMVPEKTGTMDVAPISISYFNPVTGKYEKAEIPGTTINVLGDMPQSISSGSQAAVIETLIIDQVNYADANEGYITIQLKKEMLYSICIGLLILLILIAALILLLSYKKKRDPQLRAIYKKIADAKDTNEIYNLFNSMIKHRYKLSLKASSQSVIRSSLPDAALAAQVAEIMDYMESDNARDDKGVVNLKNKITGVYRKILLAR